MIDRALPARGVENRGSGRGVAATTSLRHLEAELEQGMKE